MLLYKILLSLLDLITDPFLRWKVRWRKSAIFIVKSICERWEKMLFCFKRLKNWNENWKKQTNIKFRQSWAGIPPRRWIDKNGGSKTNVTEKTWHKKTSQEKCQIETSHENVIQKRHLKNVKDIKMRINIAIIILCA